jgi:NhaP-type Na+/H+ or K+/H+ antiporter
LAKHYDQKGISASYNEVGDGKMDLLKYIVDEAFIVIPVLWILGIFLKRTPKVKDWMILWILLGVGIAFTVAIIGFTAKAIMQGILVAGAAILGHQIVKQTKEMNRK